MLNNGLIQYLNFRYWKAVKYLYVLGRTGAEPSSLCFVKSVDAFEARDKNEVFKESIYMWWVLLDLNHRACAL